MTATDPRPAPAAEAAGAARQRPVTPRGPSPTPPAKRLPDSHIFGVGFSSRGHDRRPGLDPGSIPDTRHRRSRWRARSTAETAARTEAGPRIKSGVTKGLALSLSKEPALSLPKRKQSGTQPGRQAHRIQSKTRCVHAVAPGGRGAQWNASMTFHDISAEVPFDRLGTGCRRGVRDDASGLPVHARCRRHDSLFLPNFGEYKMCEPHIIPYENHTLALHCSAAGGRSTIGRGTEPA